MVSISNDRLVCGAVILHTTPSEARNRTGKPKYHWDYNINNCDFFEDKKHDFVQ